MIITTSYPASCSRCGGRIAVGERANWTRGGPVSHVSCPKAPAPAPTPATGNPAEKARHYGRVAVAGATERTFTVHGLAKGQDGPDNGAVRVVKGRRYVQVARTRREYLSEEYLEDLDEFDARPGGSYRWTGVEVEPTAEDAAVAQAKADAEAQAKASAAAEAQTKAEAEAQARERWSVDSAGLEASTAPPVEYTEQRRESYTLSFSPARAESVFPISLPDGVVGWVLTISSYDDHRMSYYLPPAVARQARLALAARLNITPDTARKWLLKYTGCWGQDLYLEVVSGENG